MQEAEKLRFKINNYLDNQNYQGALNELEIQIKDFFYYKKDDSLLLAVIAGSYIDVGNEAFDFESVNKGINLIIDNKEILKNNVTEDSIDYYLGNGYHALYKIALHHNTEHFPPTPKSVNDSLFEAKQHYLKAFKSIDLHNLSDYSIQILTNLGNNLNHTGRIVEALQFFDMVLKYNPDFPQAIFSKANGLIYMMGITKCPLTISLFSEIFRLFKIVDEKQINGNEIKIAIKQGLKKSFEFLEETNFDFSKINEELILSEIEYQSHNDEVKFYLDNFLNLSEHGLYCKCNGAKIDDLSISYQETYDIKIIQLEILINRIKSEFSLSRKLLFEYFTIKTIDYIAYSESNRDIINGINHEKLRTSFRLCFGIFDKIAEGICSLFNLEIKDGESIYFENFWNNPKTHQDRWDKINSIKNIHLTALYSIACDLNKSNGEFGFYKRWRNRLEHGVFSITNQVRSDAVINEKLLSENVVESDFENNALHLLQLTRATIFSFVFCIRQEL